MARSTKKGPFIDAHLSTKIEGMNARTRRRYCAPGRGARRSSLRWSDTRSRCTTARSSFPVYVTENMVGHKLGEFSFTRTFKGHSMKAATETPLGQREFREDREHRHRPRLRRSFRNFGNAKRHDMEFRAQARFMRVSPQKARLVLDLIKGQRVENALNTLLFTKKRVAATVEKLLRRRSRTPTTTAPRKTSMWISTTCTSRTRSPTRSAHEAHSSRAYGPRLSAMCAHLAHRDRAR